MKYIRYHGLGNDYLVLREQDLDAPLTPDRVIGICHRHFGVGSDGIVLIGTHNRMGSVFESLIPMAVKPRLVVTGCESRRARSTMQELYQRSVSK